MGPCTSRPMMDSRIMPEEPFGEQAKPATIFAPLGVRENRAPLSGGPADPTPEESRPEQMPRDARPMRSNSVAERRRSARDGESGEIGALESGSVPLARRDRGPLRDPQRQRTHLGVRPGARAAGDPQPPSSRRTHRVRYRLASNPPDGEDAQPTECAALRRGYACFAARIRLLRGADSNQ